MRFTPNPPQLASRHCPNRPAQTQELHHHDNDRHTIQHDDGKTFIHLLRWGRRRFPRPASETASRTEFSRSTRVWREGAAELLPNDSCSGSGPNPIMTFLETERDEAIQTRQKSICDSQCARSVSGLRRGTSGVSTDTGRGRNHGLADDTRKLSGDADSQGGRPPCILRGA